VQSILKCEKQFLSLMSLQNRADGHIMTKLSAMELGHLGNSNKSNSQWPVAKEFGVKI
jgi:hypothetical protein